MTQPLHNKYSQRTHNFYRPSLRTRMRHCLDSHQKKQIKTHMITQDNIAGIANLG